jgi:hypothetical protein
MTSTPRQETFDFALNLAFSAQRRYLDPEIDTRNIAEVLSQRRYEEHEHWEEEVDLEGVHDDVTDQEGVHDDVTDQEGAHEDDTNQEDGGVNEEGTGGSDMVEEEGSGDS